MEKQIEYFLSDKLKMDKTKLIELKELLDKCCDIYYNTPDPSPATDEEFDKLVKVFNKYSTKSYSTLTKPLSGKRIVDVSHDFPELVGTVEKANTIEEVQEWLFDRFDKDDVVEIDASLKEDGNSVTLTFDKNCKNELSLTRGKEGKGADLTKYFKHVRVAVPNKNCKFGVKCEAVMTDEDFDEYNEIYFSLNGKYLSNSRSAVAGILGSDDGVKYSKFIKLVPLAIKFKGMEITRQEELRLIEVIGTQPDFLPFTYRIMKGKRDQVIKEIEKWYKLIIDKERNEYGRPIDGIVISIMDGKKREELGRTDETNNFDIALKFPYMVKKSKVIDIKFYLGKTNRITPVVLFEDIIFNGATCNHVSISNYKRFKDLKIKKGDTVVVEYRNDVLSYIPENVDRDVKGTVIPFIKTCPACGGKLSTNKNKTFVFCKNKDCSNLILGKCVNWLVKLNIKGVKENTLSKIINTGLIHNIEDLYSLTEKELLKIDGFKEKSAKNIVDAINSKKQIYDWELLGSLHIEDFGRKSAKLACRKYNIKELYSFIKDGTFRQRIVQLKGFSDITAEKMEKGLKENVKTIKALMKILKVVPTKIDEEAMKDVKLYKIVFTGFRDKELQAKIEELGHSVTGSVSKNTDIVVTKNVNGSSSKLTTARELKKQIVTPDELKKMLKL